MSVMWCAFAEWLLLGNQSRRKGAKVQDLLLHAGHQGQSLTSWACFTYIMIDDQGRRDYLICLLADEISIWRALDRAYVR